MKLKEIKQFMKGWSDEEVAFSVSGFTHHSKSSYFSGKPKSHWMSLNFEFLRNNADLDIDFNDVNKRYANSILLISLMAYTKPKGNEDFLKFVKENQLQFTILETIRNATYNDMTNTSRSNYYFTVTDMLKNNFFDFNENRAKENIQSFFKQAITENNKKHYSEALCSIAEYFYENKENLNQGFVIEIVESFLATGKFVKINLPKILEMSDWREEQLALVNDTIECDCIIKSLNPVKISKSFNKDLNSINRSIDYIQTFISKKLYTHEQFLTIDLVEKSGNKVFIIAFDKRNVLIDTASEFITYLGKADIPSTSYEEAWNKILLKNKIENKLPEKQISAIKNKI